MSYPKLFSPLRIGPLQARNRVVFGAHFTMFTEPGKRAGEPGFYGERMARYAGERARGGAGVVIVGQAQIHPTTAYQMQNNACAWSVEAVPHFQRVSAAIHAHSSLAFLQLAHNGGVNFGHWSKLPALAPSAVVNSTEAPKVLERHELAELVEFFARSARHAVDGGFDGIEIHAAHGYLLHEFLSPRSNQRDDDYGGSLENRMRFPTEVLAAVRAAVGARIAVGLRIVGDEEVRFGIGMGAAEAAEIGARFEALGLVDFLDVSIGLSGIGMVRPSYVKHLCGVYAAKEFKQAVRHTPVFAVQRILTPAEAEGILERGEADAVTVVRALIADPEWANKADSGAADTIRACTGCNQGCYGNLTLGWPITCVTNPEVGREQELEELSPAARRKRVLVVGGGPAGLEAAWVAAARGHQVILLERDRQLGGKIRLAAQLPGRAELADFGVWRAAECERRGVEIRMGVAADVGAVLALQPDAVIVATGGLATKHGTSKMHPTPIAGVEQSFVIDHEQALAQLETLGARVLILDAVGHIEAIGIGELLARRGCEAIVVTPLPTPMLLDRETSAHALPRAGQAGMRWRPNTVLAAIGDHQVTLYDIVSGKLETVAEIDTVVIRTHGIANDALYHGLRGQVPELLRVGDAVAVRFADRAIYDGHLAGRSL